MLGGVNRWKASGNIEKVYYRISNGVILYGPQIEKDTVIYTLEEFLEVYPFKIGDKVIDTADGCQGVVCEMKWDEEVSDMKYYVEFENDDFGWFANDSIEFCKENKNLGETQSNQDIDKIVDNLEKMSVKNHKMGPKSKLPSKYYEDRLEETQPKRDIDKSEFIIKHMILPNKMDDKLEYEIIDGYEFDKVENNKIILKPIKPKYPTTYEECCEIIHSDLNFYIDTHLYSGILETLYKLLICRTAYWKIAGEELGLGKPWEPKFGKCVLFDITFYLYQDNYVLHKAEYSSSDNCILVFPTEEMRDIFYHNFWILIEDCKELL